MKLRRTIGSVLVLGFLSVPIARAEPPAKVQLEVEFLLSYIEASGCEFYRNGTWHDAKEAQAHLRSKYRYLVGINRIDATEDFIEKAATKSSLTGQPYGVRCIGGTKQASDHWLRDALARRRAP
jgi:hypothetical protein